MAVGAISSAALHLLPPPCKSCKTDESLQQLADQGDPIAIAQLDAQKQARTPAAASGAQEPGKGEAVDQYV